MSGFHAPILFLIMNFVITLSNRKDALKTGVSLSFTIKICQIVRPRSLTHRINYKFMCLSAY